MTGTHKLRLAAFALAILTVIAAVVGGRRPPAPPSTRRDAEAEAGPVVEGRPGEFRRRNPFGLQRVRLPEPPTPAPAPPRPLPPPPTRPPPPALPLKLVGTIDAGRYAMAFFTGAGPRQLALVVAADLGEHLGEGFRGLVLAEIDRGRAVFRGQGREVVLELASGREASPGGGAAPAPAPAPVVSPAPAASRAAVGQDIELSRAEVNRSLSNLAYLVTQASAQPFFDNGLPAGVRISRIRPGSVPDKLGLRNGDVLRAVDDNAIRTLGDTTKLLRAFQSGKPLKVEVLRGGRPQSFQYRFR